ncbi:MAG: hypothetical protein ABIF09_17120 [Gemmatimonadota bacterium]
MRLCAAGALVVLTTCSADDLLLVNNPEEMALDRLNDVTLIDYQVNGVLDQFVGVYGGTIIQYGAYLTDEILTGLNWEDYARANTRIASYLEGPTSGIFGGLSKGLRMGHDVSERIRVWAAEDPSEDFDEELATTLVMAGYSAMVLAENMCQSVISPDPDEPSVTVLSQLETFQAALPYLQEALTTAQSAGRSDLVNLARTGLARAHLGLGNWQEAANYANQVEAGFSYWMYYFDPDGRNPLQGTSSGANFNLGIHPWFTGTHPSFDGTGFQFRDKNVIAAQTDPRIQHYHSDATGHNGSTRLYKLYQGLRYSEYNGKTLAKASAACPNCTGTSTSGMKLLAGYDTDMVLADYLEARHHYFEALAMLGGNDAAVLAFVNSRRAVGNQAPVTLAGQALKTELKNQRGKDLFMGGIRLPDLRRWTRFDPGNGPFAAGSYFPTGMHPNALFGAYGSWTCYPIPLSEYVGNPKLPKPLDPSVPPGI